MNVFFCSLQIEQQNFQSRVNEIMGKKKQKLWEIQARVDSGKREVHCAKVWAKMLSFKCSRMHLLLVAMHSFLVAYCQTTWPLRLNIITCLAEMIPTFLRERAPLWLPSQSGSKSTWWKKVEEYFGRKVAAFLHEALWDSEAASK